MKVRTNLKYIIIFTICFLSCQSQDNELINSLGSEVKYIYGPIINIKDNLFKKKKSQSISYVSNEWQKLNKDHLRKLSRNASIDFTNSTDLSKRFASILKKSNILPKGVFINNYKFGKGHNPNNEYNWQTEFSARGYVFNEDNGANYTPFRRVKGTSARSERNRSGKKRFMEISGEWIIETTNEKNWNVTGSINTEIGGKIGIPLITEGSVKVSVNLSTGGGGSYSKKITEVIRGGNGIWVPNGKVANWELTERHRNYKTKWKIPLKFKGHIGADYGKKHYNHYYWAVPAYNFFYEYTKNDKYYIIDFNEEYSKEIRVRAWITDN